jgi:glycosyltransferase involved in cell wall biosynthesis
MRVALVANHVHEPRPSMRRFLWMLRDELLALGADVRVLAPEPVPFGERLTPRARALADKLAFQARLLGTRADVVHILDQGDAGYVRFVRHSGTVVTCHDVSVLDDPDFLGPALSSGWAYRQFLLARMRGGLRRADVLVCDSDYTERDVDRLVPGRRDQLRCRAYLPLRSLPHGGREVSLPGALSDATRPYPFHIGSNGHRKNRRQLLEVLARLPEQFLLAVAGDAPDGAFRERAAALGVANRVVPVSRPSDALLALLYERAHCLLFPSTFEGFGWPVLEAQSCGCPVVTSNVTSLPEIAGDGALFAAPDETAQQARHVEALLDSERRRELLEKGHANAKKFLNIEIGRDYASVYERLLRARAGSVV